MYIIDKNKDFYDYLSHIYGCDKAITYDRRGSNIIDDEMIANVANKYYKSWREEDDGFIILEIGNIQYLIKMFDFVTESSALLERFVSCKMEVLRTFKDNKHYYPAFVSIHGVDLNYQWSWKKGGSYKTKGSYNEVIRVVYENGIENPILANTQLTSLLDAQEVWVGLQTYISSLGNDKDISLPMTDVERAGIHGFDKKTSFRHPVK